MQPKRTLRETLDSYGTSMAPRDDPIYESGHLLILGEPQGDAASQESQEP